MVFQVVLVAPILEFFVTFSGLFTNPAYTSYLDNASYAAPTEKKAGAAGAAGAAHATSSPSGLRHAPRGALSTSLEYRLSAANIVHLPDIIEASMGGLNLPNLDSLAMVASSSSYGSSLSDRQVEDLRSAAADHPLCTVPLLQQHTVPTLMHVYSLGKRGSDFYEQLNIRLRTGHLLLVLLATPSHAAALRTVARLANEVMSYSSLVALHRAYASEATQAEEGKQEGEGAAAAAAAAPLPISRATFEAGSVTLPLMDSFLNLLVGDLVESLDSWLNDIKELRAREVPAAGAGPGAAAAGAGSAAAAAAAAASDSGLGAGAGAGASEAREAGEAASVPAGVRLDMRGRPISDSNADEIVPAAASAASAAADADSSSAREGYGAGAGAGAGAAEEGAAPVLADRAPNVERVETKDLVERARERARIVDSQALLLVAIARSVPRSFLTPSFVVRTTELFDLFLDRLVTRSDALRFSNREQVSFRPGDLLSVILRVFLDLAAVPDLTQAGLAGDSSAGECSAVGARGGQALLEAMAETDHYASAAQALRKAAQQLVLRGSFSELDRRAMESHVQRIEAAVALRKLRDDYRQAHPPDPDFEDLISAQVMQQPVRVGGHSNLMDYASIMRTLAQDNMNPFTKQPVGLAQIVPDVALRERIARYLEEERVALATWRGGEG